MDQTVVSAARLGSHRLPATADDLTICRWRLRLTLHVHRVLPTSSPTITPPTIRRYEVDYSLYGVRDGDDDTLAKELLDPLQIRCAELHEGTPGGSLNDPR